MQKAFSVHRGKRLLHSSSPEGGYMLGHLNFEVVSMYDI